MTTETKEKLEPTITKDPQSEKEIHNLIELVTKQSELNNSIIQVISNKSISKEDHIKLVGMLESGAQNNAFIMSVMKKTNTIYDNIPPKGEIKDPLNKFKNIIASFKANIDETIAFRNPLNPDWYEMGYKAAIVLGKIEKNTQPIKTTYSSLVTFFQKQAKNTNVFLHEIKSMSEKVQDTIFLIGEKRNVKQLQKKFSKTFEFLGLNNQEFVSDANFVENISKEELINKIAENISKKITAIKNEEKYSFTILEGLSQDLQFEMLQNVIWPKVKLAIKENMEINNSISLTKDENKYIKMINDFSKENNFNPDLVIHSLKNNSELLNGYNGTEKLLTNKEKIIENAGKYEKAISNNLTYLQELILISKSIEDNIKDLPVLAKIKAAFSKDMNESIVFEKNDLKINFKQIKQNLIEAEKEKNIINNKFVS